MTVVNVEPGAHAVDIGSGCFIEYAEYGGETAGVNEWHRNAAGEWCRGWVAFNGSAWANHFSGVKEFQGWDVVKRDPLTLSPSIKCRACGHHGHIQAGKWVPA